MTSTSLDSISDNSDSAKDSLSKFFNFIWGDIQGFVYLPLLDRSKGPKAGWRSIFYEWPKHRDAIIHHVITGTAKGLEVYYSPAIYKGEGPGNPGRPIKSNVLGTNVLWTEFDGNAPTFSEDLTLPEQGDAATGRETGAQALPLPSLRVQSSADQHEHVYWKLDEFQANVNWIEDKNRAITYSFRADTSGWDVTQILRPPFTTNFKRDLPVTIIGGTDKPYSAEDFKILKPPPIIVSESIVVDDLPAVESVIAHYAWDPDTFKMFMDPHIPEGHRSSALMRLGYFCAEQGMSDTEAYAVLFNADERWGKYSGRRDQKRRLVDIIDRARQKYPQAVTLTLEGLIGGNTTAPVERGLDIIYGFKDFLNSSIEVEWAIEGLLEVGGFGMVASMPGVGKTQLSIQLGMACALGSQFLRWTVPRPMKIVLLSLEMSHVGLKIFMEKIAEGYTDEQHKTLQENFIIAPVGEAIALDKPQGLQFLEMILDEIQPDGIIVDSIGKLSLEDLSDKTAKALNDKFAHLRNKYQSFLWFVHHNRKATENNKKPTGLSDVYGNVYITTDMTSIITLWPVDDGKAVEVISSKSRLSEPFIPFKANRTPYLTFEEAPTDEQIRENLTKVGEKDDNDPSNAFAI